MQQLHDLQRQAHGKTLSGPRHRWWQRPKRQVQARIRRRAVDFCRWSRQQGQTLNEVARRLGLRPRTLRQWDYACRRGHAGPLLLGRPLSRSDVGQRQKVVEFLMREGPSTAVATLREAFPAATRAELAHMLQRYRRVLRKRYHDTGLACCWPVPGRVWAMDFAEPSELGGIESLPPVDGLYPYLLAVRDLASGYQLAWLPVGDMTAGVVVQTLAWLFARHGAPLVLKCDNGSAFIAERTKILLEDAGVMALFSPPHYPPYNGAIEAGIGSLKNRTARHAARQGRLSFWACEDVEAARWEANTMARPHGLRGPTPSHVWQAREPISPLERTRFELTVARHGLDLRATHTNDDELDHWQQSEIDRKILTRALVEHAYLLVTRRRIPLTHKSRKVANIT